MPRTKVAKKKVTSKSLPFVTNLIEEIEANRKAIKLKLNDQHNECIESIAFGLKKSKLSIPVALLNKTVGELIDAPPNWNGDNTSNSTEASIVQILDSTKCSTVKSKRLLRTNSVGDDEGYLTAESTNSTSGTRKSRARDRLQKTTRVSRSLSNRNQKPDASVLGKFKTPSNKHPPPASYGTITPKVAPNVPQVLLRRPKQGEVALSLQGSPLFTGSVVTDAMANVNIPLDDGRVLSIQPQKGLRMSQIPQLDPETKRQLETLRDNLNKVCAITAKR